VSHSGRCMVELPALVALILLACAAGSAQASPNNNNNKNVQVPDRARTCEQQDGDY